MREIFNEVWMSAQRNKLRTILTGFAVAWGIFMIITLLGAGNGLINAQLQQMNRRLTNSMIVYGGTTSKPFNGLKEGRRINLKNSDIDITSTAFTENVDEVGAMLYTNNITVAYGNNYITTWVAGVGPNHIKINKMELLCGRFINNIDVSEQRKVLVVSNKQAEDLCPGNYKKLLGKWVKLNSFAFRVVGILRTMKTDVPTHSPHIQPFRPSSTMATMQVVSSLLFTVCPPRRPTRSLKAVTARVSTPTIRLLPTTRVLFGSATVLPRASKWKRAWDISARFFGLWDFLPFSAVL